MPYENNYSTNTLSTTTHNLYSLPCMDPDNELLDDINNYLNNTLPPESRTTFEARLLTDESLRDEVDLQQTIREGVLQLYYKNLFHTLHTELQANGTLLPATNGRFTPEYPENH